MRTTRTRPRVVGGALALAGFAVVVIAGCFGTTIFDEGTNHPPKTVYLDDSLHSTPKPGATVHDSVITMQWVGTDQQDGDAIAAYFYRISPPDTGWATTTIRNVTFNVRDSTTYTFCVYAEDVRGGIEPQPNCRSFYTDIFRLGAIEMEKGINDHTGNPFFAWSIVGSELPPTAWHYFRVRLVTSELSDPYHLPTAIDTLNPIPDGGYEFEADPTLRYCLTVEAHDLRTPQDTLRQQLCYP